MTSQSLFCHPRTSVLALIALAGILAFSTIGSAQVITQAFDSPQGGLPENWRAVLTGTAGQSIAQISEVSSGGGDWRLLMQRVAGGGQAVFYEGELGGGMISNFTATATLRFTGYGGDPYGIVGRAQTDTYGYSGYYAYTYTTGGITSLIISKNPTASGSTYVGTMLASVALTQALAVGVDYQYNFSAVGNTLTASVFRMDSSGSPSVELGSVSVNDSSYTSGYFGFRDAPGLNGRGMYVSDLTLTAVPEPGISMLGALSVFSLVLAKKLRYEKK